MKPCGKGHPNALVGSTMPGVLRLFTLGGLVVLTILYRNGTARERVRSYVAVLLRRPDGNPTAHSVITMFAHV